MASQGNPQTWVPFDNIKDCSQGFCSLYCPQWCYFIFPPPPPLGFDEDDSKTNFSPLVIAIIGTLASAFLLVSYYTVISKYCGSLDSLIRRGRRNNRSEGQSNENQNQSNNEAWQGSTTGLDEALIKLITVCKYKKGDGFVEGTDCSVCLSEFQEGENLRLLPKCNHAFHLPCIDTWLKSHSNCPLCRAIVVSSTSPLPLPFLPPVQGSPPDDDAAAAATSTETQQSNHTAVAVEELGRSSCEEASVAISDVAPKTSTEASDDAEDLEERDAIIEIRDEQVQPIRRSISMGYSYREHVSVAEILCLSEDDDSSLENHQIQAGIESSSKQQVGDHSKASNSRILHCVMNPTAMKRSFSSGRLLFSRNKRGRNIVIPM